MNQTASIYHRDLSELVGKYKTVAEFLPAGARVLELGCASGYFARALELRGHSVVGLEGDPLAAEEARAQSLEVHDADLSVGIPTHIAINQFDAVLAMDILEHLPNPEKILTELYEGMKPGARLIVTGPNVAHLSMRLRLLNGQWNYTDTGILDRTHLRFYTLTSWIALIANVGFTVYAHRAAEDAPLPANRLFTRVLGKSVSQRLCSFLTKRYPRLFAVVVLVVGHKI